MKYKRKNMRVFAKMYRQTRLKLYLSLAIYWRELSQGHEPLIMPNVF